MPLRWLVRPPSADRTRSSPAGPTPSRGPLDGVTIGRPRAMSRPRQRASSASGRCPGARAARRNAGTSRTSASMRVQSSARPVAVSSAGVRTLRPKPMATHSAELAPPDVQVVRPLHADRRGSQIVERLGRVEAAPNRQHVERSCVGRALDQREPDALTGRRQPPAALSASPRGLLVGQHQRARRHGRRNSVRDVERGRDRRERVDARHAQQRRELGGRVAVVADRRPLSG